MCSIQINSNVKISGSITSFRDIEVSNNITINQAGNNYTNGELIMEIRKGIPLKARCYNIDQSGQYFITDSPHHYLRYICLSGIDKTDVQINDEGFLTYHSTNTRGWYTFTRQ